MPIRGAYVRDMAQQLTVAHGDKYVRPPTGMMAGVPGLPPADRADDEAGQQRELHLDALIARAKGTARPGTGLTCINMPCRTIGRLPRRSGSVRRRIRRLVFRNGAVRHRAGRALASTGWRGTAISTAERRPLVPVDRLRRRKDRVVQRENGLYTLFRFRHRHLNKFERGFDRIINIWGADHHGYIPRVKGAVRALEGSMPTGCKWRWSSSPFSIATARRRRCPPRSGEFVTLRTARQTSATTPAASSTLRKSDDISISTSIWRKEPDQRKSGLLHPVRACPHLLGHRAVGRRFRSASPAST